VGVIGLDGSELAWAAPLRLSPFVCPVPAGIFPSAGTPAARLLSLAQPGSQNGCSWRRESVPPILLQWWRRWRDPQLDDLIAPGAFTDNNLDLQDRAGPFCKQARLTAFSVENRAQALPGSQWARRGGTAPAPPTKPKARASPCADGRGQQPGPSKKTKRDRRSSNAEMGKSNIFATIARPVVECATSSRPPRRLKEAA